jgi:hypothetical protein
LQHRMDSRPLEARIDLTVELAVESHEWQIV